LLEVPRPAPQRVARQRDRQEDADKASEPAEAGVPRSEDHEPDDAYDGGDAHDGADQPAPARSRQRVPTREDGDEEERHREDEWSRIVDDAEHARHEDEGQ
jgi:hypothetical protein